MKKDEKAPKAVKKTKKQKPEKAKKVKGAKAAKAPKAPRDPSEKKKIPKILLIILPVVLLLAIAVVVVYLIFFRTPSEEEKNKKIAENQDAYIMGEDEVISLEKVLKETMGDDEEEALVVRTSVETPTENGPKQWTYHYREVNDTPSKLAASYAEYLQSEEVGFVLTDDTNHELEEEPDMEAAIGSVILARTSVESASYVPPDAEGSTDGSDEGKADSGADGEEAVDKILQLRLAWSETALAIQVSQPEGTILPPVVEEDPASAPIEPVALMAQLDYFSKLPAAKLGLPGDSMAEYRVYPVEGWVRVSGVTCRVLNVYVLDLPEETNTFMGTFYLSSDNSQLFKLDESSGVIVKVDLS